MYQAEPELIFTNGKLVTLDDDDSIHDAIAVRDGRIVALGGSAEIEALAGPATELRDLAGATVIPGIVDSHCHPDGAAARVATWHELSPANIPDRAALLSCIDTACRAAPRGAWFSGYRLNELKSGGYPTLAELDAASHGHPLFILRTDGHLGLANSAGFAALGIDKHSNDPPFGRFDRDPKSGELTGLLREAATTMFLDSVHAGDTIASLAEGLVTIFDDYLRHGITTAYNSLTSSKAIAAYQTLKDAGRLKLRVGIIVAGREEGLVEAYIKAGIRSGFGDDWLRVIAVEWCPDCSTSGRTAAYYQPYVGAQVVGEPDNNTGMLLYELEDLTARALAAHRAGLQVCIEGVGDRGIDFALDAIAAVLQAEPRADHRMRVEHCCYVTPKIRQRLQDLAVIDSSATGFMYELGDAYVANRGLAAMADMWPHRALIDAGVVAPGHSDSYICSPNPFNAIWSMVNRQSDSGGALDAPGQPSQSVTVTEALKAYTILGAYSGREETIKGSLELGKLADMAILDRDILSIDSQEIRDIRVVETLVGGQTMYQAES